MIYYIFAFILAGAQEVPVPTGDVTEVLAWALGVVVLALGGLWAANAKGHASTIADLRSSLAEEKKDKQELVTKLFKIQETTMGAMKDLGFHVEGTNKAVNEQTSRVGELSATLMNIAVDIKAVLNNVQG